MRWLCFVHFFAIQVDEKIIFLLNSPPLNPDIIKIVLMKQGILFTIGLAVGLIMAAPRSQAQFFTGPFGPGGTWNLYEVTNTSLPWKAGHQVAVAKTAASTGVAGVAGNVTTGHLAAIGNWQESAMVSLMAIRHTNSSNVWIGLCDSDDADLGGVGWVDAQPATVSDQWFWAGYTAGAPGRARTAGQR